MSGVLWTTGDLAAASYLQTSAVYMRLDRGDFPEPEFTTVKGVRLWTPDRAWRIVTMLREENDTRRRKAARVEEEKQRDADRLRIAINAHTKEQQ